MGRKFEMVILDFDGTLIEFNLPFDKIRKKLGIEKTFVLESILEIEDERKKSEALQILNSYEVESVRKSRAAYYALELLEDLERAGMIKGVVTRNSKKSVEIAAKKFGFRLDFIISREDAKPKPSPEPILLALSMFGVKPENAITVGDFIFDLIAGREAGTKTALILNERNRWMMKSFVSYADYVFESLRELAEFLEVGKSD